MLLQGIVLGRAGIPQPSSARRERVSQNDEEQKGNQQAVLVIHVRGFYDRVVGIMNKHGAIRRNSKAGPSADDCSLIEDRATGSKPFWTALKYG